MGLIYFFLACIGNFLLFAVIVESEKWVKHKYIDINILIRWILFLPISIIRSILITLILGLSNLYICPINKDFALFINWAISPIFLFYSIGITIPKFKRVVPVFLATIWVILGIIEISKQYENWIIRIFQITAIIIYIVITLKQKKADKINTAIE